MLRAFGLLKLGVQTLIAVMMTVLATRVIASGLVEPGSAWMFLMLAPLVLLWLRIVFQMLKFGSGST